ncbi:MAG TPA: LysM peptidoglycan-binding domain-containing protein [Acidimicrobiales bacterium]|nr:LysM peptidoglycan-binding domain-containing protein [Acidimicrobiales bacterium]
MTVAYELEYETYRPRLQLVAAPPRRQGPGPRSRRLVLLAGIVVTLLVLLMLPIRALGGQTVGTAPIPGQEYVVRSGDTLASIAGRADGANVAGMTHRLADEIGSTVVVPGEHLFIP